MDRVAFTLFGIDIMWYGILMATGMVLGVFIALREAKRLGIKEDDILEAFSYRKAYYKYFCDYWYVKSKSIGAYCSHKIIKTLFVQNKEEIVRIRYWRLLWIDIFTYGPS